MPPVGNLQVQVLQSNTYIPVENAKISILSAGKVPGRSLITDSSGLTNRLELQAPPLDFSMKPLSGIPYSTYDLNVQAPGYVDIVVRGAQIYPGRLAIQQCRMQPIGARQTTQIIINILPNRLVGNFPPKIPEDPNKPEPKPPSGFVVLPEPVAPRFITVHQGDPNDPNAPNYTVYYKEYIKNVASCEIFSTWPETTIAANIYCIVSFTLNRIYTEWYRGKGKNFDITSSTAYDHAFTFGRNIYANISRIVDRIFASYMKRPGKKQPLLTQYCDGIKVQCPNWLTQWGSKYLGDKGYSPYQILTHFYGNDLNITIAKKVAGTPMSYPGYILRVGSSGAPVSTIQKYLNRISNNYPSIIKLAVNGYFDNATKKSVLKFQQTFFLAQTGAVDYATWYKISDVYVAVTGIAELKPRNSNNEKAFIPPVVDTFRLMNAPKVFYPTEDN
jgi:peptidoglycan hydrolase-like protein with peptidoglycan-binding domain